MSDRATLWSVTINNPTSSDEEFINLARQRGWTVSGQLEKGENGTPHYQLAVKTPQVRFSALKKAFPRAHIEKGRNAPALLQYVEKDETRIGELTSQSEMYPSLAKFWLLVCTRYQREFCEIDLPYIKTNELLANFDTIVRSLITDGYHVETMAVNPQMRACWKNYADAIYRRCCLETDRQRQQQLISQEVTIPTANAPEESPEASCTEGSQASTAEDEDDEEFSESEYSQI